MNELAFRYGIKIEPAEPGADQAEVDEQLVSILAAAGVPIREKSEADRILGEEIVREWRKVLEPVAVMEEGTLPLVIPLRLSREIDPECRWTVAEENGSRHEGSFRASELPVESEFEGGGHRFVRRLLSLELRLPPGYHELTLSMPDPGDQLFRPLRIIITPRQCYLPPGLMGDSRIWGLSIHPQAIRSTRNWGVGDFSDLQQLLSWGAEQGAGVISTSPLRALSWPMPKFPNPYSASCRSLINVHFLDVEAIPDMNECEEVRQLVRSARFQARLAAFRDQEDIDHGGVFETKCEIFKLLWPWFFTNHLNPETGRGRSFRRFQEEGGETLRSYAIFAALQEKFSSETRSKQGWAGWPAEFRNPHSDAVAEFASQHQQEIEYHQYLQWHAEIQLGAIGRRSMELGLKLGFLEEFVFAPAPDSFETWYYQGLLVEGLLVERNPLAEPGDDPSVGLSAPLPNFLRELGYRPLIEGLRRTMRHTGALLIRGMANYREVHLSLSSGPEAAVKAVLQLPFPEILGIIALESQRSHCVVISDKVHFPEKEEQLLQEKNILRNLFCFHHEAGKEEWPGIADYPQDAMICPASPFFASIRGYWAGKDISLKAGERIFFSEAEKEKVIIGRAADRAHFLITLEREGLLPEGYSIDPAAVSGIDQALFTALQVFLARTPARIILLPLSDLLETEEQASPPAMRDQHFWRTGYPLELDKILASQEVLSVFITLRKERGIGVVRPSAPALVRKKREGIRIPAAFYRVQLNKDFTFRQAAEIIPYMKTLGISHCYSSPFLMARPGSSHGYDIINHASINPEIGSREDFEYFISVLEQHRMALLLDIVPNHMGVGSDNHWWMDVLENAEASEYADFFDINWLPQQPNLAGKVLLPILGDHYGKVLESGELTLGFDDGSGSFTIHYYEHRFPVAPRTYSSILKYDLKRLEGRLGKEHHGCLELQTLITSFSNLPGRNETSEEKLHIRSRNKEVNKRTLARLCRETPEIREFIEENIIIFNGEAGRPESYDLLHRLLENQAYRLAFWRVAADEINYRRFFDINDLAGLRMQEEKVFQETHRLVSDLIITGKLDGLRIDHPDGLYDPYHYFCRLQSIAGGELPENLSFSRMADAGQEDFFLYVVVEKILAGFEHLPEGWPVNGTTGYEFSNMLNGIFVDTAAEKAMTAIYHRFIGARMDFETLAYRSKKLIISSSMAGELNVLAGELYRLAQASRYTRDFTLNRLRQALMEIVAAFPVYRTYIGADRIHKSDISYIDWAVAKAKGRSLLDDDSIFGFIRDVLLLESDVKEVLRKRHLDFVLKFQQYTGPVMAKGLEDTTFYIYNRLLSLNEVGGEPERFGASVAAFHRVNQDRLRFWPHAMLNTSTHDSKRSEDVRARINVLTEIPQIWQERVSYWNRVNRSKKSQVGEMMAPSKNDEYAFYQNLIGAWPVAVGEGDERRALVERLKAYMVKACREAKEHTSWVNPTEAYENAVESFVEGTLASSDDLFLRDFLLLQQEVSWFGMLNSLSQTFLKLTAPGVPEIYQGNEIWRFCLVDPDSRRPVDFPKRRAMLEKLLVESEAGQEEKSGLLHGMLTGLHDGRAKMYVIAGTLRFREEWREVFEQGAYLPLEIAGDQEMHLCAFARKLGEKVVIAVAPRHYLKLMGGKRDLPLGPEVWGETVIKLPAEIPGGQFENLFTRETVVAGPEENVLKVADLLRSWPVALLRRIED